MCRDVLPKIYEKSRILALCRVNESASCLLALVTNVSFHFLPAFLRELTMARSVSKRGFISFRRVSTR